MRALRSLIPRRGALAQFASLRWAALPITNRRWTLPMSAMALGLGLFIGIAIGPGISKTLGTTPLLVVTGPDDSAPEQVASVGGAHKPPAQPNTPKGKPPSAHGGGTTLTPTPNTGFGSALPPASPPPSTSGTTSTTTQSETTSDETDETQSTPEDTSTDLVLRGTVIHVNPLARSYVLTTASGQMSAVHAGGLPKAGAKLEVPVRELANGTYAEAGRAKRSGSATSARLQGIVTFADPATGAYTVSHKGASVLVHSDRGETASAPPSVGAQLAVTAKLGPAPVETVDAPPESTTTTTTVPPTTTTPPPPAGRRDHGCGNPPATPNPPDESLLEVSRVVQVPFVHYTDFEGIVQGVCPRELVLSADDLRESEADISVPLAKRSGIDLGSISPGDIVDASGTIDADTGALALTGISSDEGIKRADDADLKQGDQSS